MTTQSQKHAELNGGPKKKSSSEKQFIIRNSPLIDRYEKNEDINTIYNLFTVILIGLLTNTIIHDISKTGQLHLGLRLIIAGFNKFDLVIVIWCCLNFLAYAVYFGFSFWAKIYLLLEPKRAHQWKRIWFPLVFFYYIFALYGVQKMVFLLELAPGSAAILILEQVRLLMKQHSFLRTNAPRVLNYKPHSDQTLELPNLKRFIFFTFVPTFIYRDEYPRTENIRWKFVFYNLMEVIGIIFLISLVTERLLVPPFEEYGLRKFSKSEILMPIFGNSFPGILFLLGGFYSVLHSTQNAFAEMLRFGDRMFYKEWWTSRSLSEYYRTWNVIVHDWLFQFIYKDMYEIVCPRNKCVAKLTVFLLSALMHEWIMSTVLGLFLPIQFIEFFLSGALLTLCNGLDAPVGNLVVWYCFVLGSGIQANMYTMEYFARLNCPISEGNASSWDFYKPRFLTCDCIE